MTYYRVMSLRTCLLLGTVVTLLSVTPNDAHAGMPSVSLTA